MRIGEALYEAVLTGARPLARAAAVAGGEVRKGVLGREATLRRFEAWGAEHRDPSRPLVWLHAPSVGEGLMAQAIIAGLRARHPDLQVAFTHFSTSAERIADSVGADVWGYLPWDTRGPMRRAIEALRPSSLAFVRTEIWPVAVREARRAGARVVLVNAVLSEGSGRLRWPARGFLAPSYGMLDAIGAVSEGHARRFERLGVPASRTHVTGDARFDQVLERIEDRGLVDYRRAGSGGDGPDLFDAIPTVDAFTVVAGSTWPADEAVLVPAIAALAGGVAGSGPGDGIGAPGGAGAAGSHSGRVCLIVAPHEPTAAHLEGLERRLTASGVAHVRLGRLLDGEVDPAGGAVFAVVVDRLGVLADLYALADVAYVGGGFGSAGLHSVVEPAALGVPVAFGPSHGNAREAAELVQAGGGMVVEDASELVTTFRRMAMEPESLASAGAEAEAFVHAGRGAAERNAALILDGQ